MSNRLKMAIIQYVLQLHARRWSFRRLAREMHIHWGTVSRYVRLAEAKPATESPTVCYPPCAGFKTGQSAHRVQPQEKAPQAPSGESAPAA